jgi:hypothetical protein
MTTPFMAPNADGIEVVPENRWDPSFDGEENDELVNARQWRGNSGASSSG